MHNKLNEKKLDCYSIRCVIRLHQNILQISVKYLLLKINGGINYICESPCIVICIPRMLIQQDINSIITIFENTHLKMINSKFH